MKKIGKGLFGGLAITAALLLLAGAAGADQRQAAPRIIGGEPAGEWPGVAALVETGQDPYFGHFGAGVLVHPDWVVTSAQNVMADAQGTLLPPAAIEVVLGTDNLFDNPPERIQVSQIVVHPEYDPATQHADIALLELAESSAQEPVAFCSQTEPPAEGSAVVLGWGIADYEDFPAALQMVEVPLVPAATCTAAYGEGAVSNTLICAGAAEGGVGPCIYDTGGPLMIEGEGEYRLAGLVSQGDNCAQPETYAMYTWIPAVQEFIDAYVPAIALAEALYFPHVAVTSGWETEIRLINGGDSEAAVQVQAHDGMGLPVGEPKSLSLAPGAMAHYTVSQDFADPGAIRYLKAESESDAVKGNSRFCMPGVYSAAVPAMMPESADTLYLPHICCGNGDWTGVALVNTGMSDKTVEMAFNTGDTKTLVIPAGAQKVFTVGSLFDGEVPEGLSHGWLKNGQGLVGLAIFSQKGEQAAQSLAGMALSGRTTDWAVYPHVADNEYWQSYVGFMNPTDSPAFVTLYSYAGDGTQIAWLEFELGAKERILTDSMLSELLKNAAWLEMESSAPVAEYSLFKTASGAQMAALCSDMPQSEGILPITQPEGWSGIALVNLGQDSAIVTLTAHDADGAAITSAEIALGAGVKWIQVVQDLFEAEIRQAAYIGYASDTELAGLVLNGSGDGTRLDGLSGR